MYLSEISGFSRAGISPLELLFIIVAFAVLIYALWFIFGGYRKGFSLGLRRSKYKLSTDCYYISTDRAGVLLLTGRFMLVNIALALLPPLWLVAFPHSFIGSQVKLSKLWERYGYSQGIFKLVLLLTFILAVAISSALYSTVIDLAIHAFR
jgi:hypothetical protein